METHKELMRSYLCESLRQLMERTLFEKITIKQICDRAGVIRATFYNYFDDKYDCLSSIVFLDLSGILDDAEQEAPEELLCRLMKMTRPTVMRLNTKANTVTSLLPRPMRIASAAPKAAPDEAPRISGAAMGFWKTP